MISILPTLTLLLVAVIQSPKFDVVVGSGEVGEALLSEVRQIVVQQTEVLRPTFPGLELKPFHVFVHGAAQDMPPALAALRHEGAPGFALLGRHQIHLVIGDIKRTGVSLRSVVTHELVHELLDQFVTPFGAEIPRWYHEGLAQYLAGDTYLGAREEDIVWRVTMRKLHSLADLRDGFPIDEEPLRVAYAQSYSYVAWLIREFGLDDVVRVAKNTDDLTRFERALVGETGRTTLELDDAWKLYLQYGSGAWWRVLMSQCFNVLMILALPAFGVAVWRRRMRARLLARRMAQREAMFPHEFDLEREDSESGQNGAGRILHWPSPSGTPDSQPPHGPPPDEPPDEQGDEQGEERTEELPEDEIDSQSDRPAP